MQIDPEHPRVDEVERAFRHWTARVLPGPSELRTLPLTRVAEQPRAAGTTPAVLFEDPTGRQVLFRAASAREIAAEGLAQRVRTLGGRPHMPLVRRRLELAPGVVREGIARPYLPEALPLPRDPEHWSPLDCGYLLREHPWEWLLANLDTHAGQYLRVGPMRLPINIDWDRSLADLHIVELDRFTRRVSVLIPARNRLYDLYATNRVSLRFRGLWGQVARAATLSRTELTDAVLTYANESGHQDPSALVEQVLARQEALPLTFERFVGALRDERARWRRAHGQRDAGVTRAHWMDRFARIALSEPPPRVTRSLLAAWRWLRHLQARLASPLQLEASRVEGR